MASDRLSALVGLIEPVGWGDAFRRLVEVILLLLGSGSSAEKVVLIHSGVSKLLLDRCVVGCTDLLINIQRARDTLERAAPARLWIVDTRGSKVLV